MTQSEVFSTGEADKYIQRNIKNSHSYAVEYLLSVIDKNWLADSDIAEFGIGPGYNLNLLSHYASKVHGYDVSEIAIKYFRESIHPGKEEKLDSMCVNLCKPFNSMIKYDLIIWGFFAYYVDNTEIKQVKKNTLDALKKNSYVMVNDFLVRTTLTKVDERNSNLSVFKRDLPFWLDLFQEFDMIDFRLFNSNRKKYYLQSNDNCIDSFLDGDDNFWEFCAIFKRRS